MSVFPSTPGWLAAGWSSQTRRFWTVGLALLLAGGGVRADEPREPVTLSAARALAFTRNWDLLAAKAGVDIVEAGQIVAKEFPNPVLATSITKLPVGSQSGGTVLGNEFFERSYDTVAAVSQLVEIGGKRQARGEAAKAGAGAARARFQDARRQLEVGVTRAYVAALLAGENVRVLQASAASLRKEADIAAARLKAGDIARADRDQIEVAATRLELDSQRAAADATAARIQLEVLLGVRAAKGAIALADSLEQLVGQSSGPLPDHGPVPADRPDVLAARLDVQAAEAQLRLQHAQRVPDPTFLAQYEREPPDQPNTIGFGVSFPLPLWNRNRGAIQAARAAREQAEVRATQTEAAAAAEIAIAEAIFTSATERQQQYATQILPRSASVTETVKFAYEKGGASLLDLLSAERNDNDTRLAAAAAKAELVSSRVALEAALNFTNRTASLP